MLFIPLANAKISYMQWHEILIEFRVCYLIYVVAQHFLLLLSISLTHYLKSNLNGVNMAERERWRRGGGCL